MTKNAMLAWIRAALATSGLTVDSFRDNRCVVIDSSGIVWAIDLSMVGHTAPPGLAQSNVDGDR